ncbi:hypothetical protein C8F04DRAFT_905690, partial [Mycena alexandri]
IATVSRIHCSGNQDRQSRDIQAVGIETDHRLVSVKISTEEAPTIGHGRWRWPVWLIRDKELSRFIQEEGIKLQDEMESIKENEARGQRHPTHNAQTLWANFKAKIGKKAKERARVTRPKLQNEIDELIIQRTLINDADPEQVSEDEKLLSSAVLTEKIQQLKKKQHHTSRLTAQVRNRLEGEVIGTYWTAINKPKKPRDIILRLKKDSNPTEPPKYETNSKRMATMACDYHDKIQNARERFPTGVREEKITAVLGRITKTVTPEQADSLKKKLTLEDVRYALRQSANNRAPGLDGIIYEVWRILDQRYESFKATDRPAFNVLGALLRVYNDIEGHGMVAGTRFSESWMCPLYKKNDRADIANYRPISLLNTDYKIFTKALAIKL